MRTPYSLNHWDAPTLGNSSGYLANATCTELPTYLTCRTCLVAIPNLLPEAAVDTLRYKAYWRKAHGQIAFVHVCD